MVRLSSILPRAERSLRPDLAGESGWNASAGSMGSAMTGDPGHTGRRSSATISSVLAPASAGLGALLLVVTALAQDLQPAQPGSPQAPPSSEPAPPAAATPGPSFQPGFID